MAKKDPAADLAMKLIATLEELRRKSPDSYPPTVERLARELNPPASSDMLRKAIKKSKGFLDKVVVVRRGDLLSPLALLDDERTIVESPRIVDYLLRLARTPTNQVFSIAQLKNKVSSHLKQSFSAAANRLMDENRLPPSIAWIYVNKTRKVFLLEDLHRSTQPSTQVSRPPSGQEGTVRPKELPISTAAASFSREFDTAFEKLNRREGSMNFVSLVDLRRELTAFPRTVFDAELRKLWSEGRYSLRAAEGRFGISPEEREAGFLQEGTLLLFVSRNTR